MLCFLPHVLVRNINNNNNNQQQVQQGLAQMDQQSCCDQELGETVNQEVASQCEVELGRDYSLEGTIVDRFSGYWTV